MTVHTCIHVQEVNVEPENPGVTVVNSENHGVVNNEKSGVVSI